MGYAGCQADLREVDAKTRKLVADRSTLIDGRTKPPDLRYASQSPGRRGEQLDKAPPTVNPAASELHFQPAEESRDITARLEQYASGESDSPSARKPVELSLADAFRTAQQSAGEYLTAEEEYIFSAISLLVERHMWGPRLFNDTSVMVAGQGTEGDFQSALAVINSLKVTQKLPYGGSVEAAWVWNATEQLRQQATGRYTQSSDLVLSGNIPLLRGAGLVAQESLIQAERSLVYQARTFESFRRGFLVDIASDYFNLLQRRSEIVNQGKSLENLRRIQQQQQALFQAGRIAAFDANIAANDVLSAEASLASQQESYILALDRFKLRLGMRPEQRIALSEEVPMLRPPEVTLEQATEYALTYRLDLQNQRDQLDDARRAVENAKNNLLPDLNLSGSVTIPTDPRAREGGLLFQPDETRYQAGMTLSAPLDREIERLQLRQATVRLQQSQRNYEIFRDNVAIGVRESVRNIDLARFQLRLAEERVRVNQERVEELKLKSDQVNTQTQVDAANSLQESLNALDQAKTSERIAILNYLKDAGLLRVQHDGTFQPLPGMELANPPGSQPAPQQTGPGGNGH